MFTGNTLIAVIFFYYSAFIVNHHHLVVVAIPKQNFYPYGPNNGDLELSSWDDRASDEVQLQVPICFFGQCHRSVFVNSNGLLSFFTEIPNYSNVEITKLPYPVIAIFYADVDVAPEGQNGRILYRTTQDRDLLQKSSEMVQSKAYADYADYEAKLLLIATWDSVGRYSARTDKQNSFQLVISTDGNVSYAEFLYAQDGINWIDSGDKFAPHDSPTAQAGFAAPNAPPYLLPQSNAPTMTQIAEHSNVGLPGMFLYRISDREIDGKMSATDDDDEDNDDYEYEYNTESEEAAVSREVGNNQVDQTMEQCLVDARVCQQQRCAARTNSRGCVECLCNDNEGESQQQEDNTVPALPVCPNDPYKGHCPNGCPLVSQGNCQRCYCHYVPTTTANPRSHAGGTAYQRREQCYNCHRLAECEQYTHGSCCRCPSGLVGDGHECVKEDDAQRVSGRLTGRLNGIDLVDSELHTYAVLSDGRTYTAFSRVPQKLGPSMLLLSTLGSVMGWLFAKPVTAIENGFSLTGGRFNRSVTVHVSDKYMVTIQQDFLGRDEYQYLRCETFISGSLPAIAADATVEFGDHFEEYVRAEKTIVKSYANLMANVGSTRYSVVVDQTIRFQPCAFLSHRLNEKLLLRADRSYSVYDQHEQIVRYASGNSIETPGAAESYDNPCRDGAHDCTGQNMKCVAEGDRHRCACNHGYRMQMIERRMTCVDIDECREDQHRCDSNADCHNLEGGYLCQCHSGYEGDGYRCSTTVDCRQKTCAPYAICQLDRRGRPQCVCASGYVEDASGHCQPSADRRTLGTMCRSHDECSKHAQCVYNEAVNYYQCQCRPPYSGDGVHCFLEAETCEYAHNCHAEADCVYEQHERGGGYRCRCRSGFTGNGYDCRPLENIMQQMQCNVLNNCGQRAECVFDVMSNSYRCDCLPGYKGDGYTCHADEPPETTKYACHSGDDCHLNAHCIVDDRTEQYVCECLPGFKGDGKTYCETADECNPGAEQNGCALHAACAYSDSTQAYTCQCMHGYTGDGKTCTEMQIKDCSMDRSLCHRHADCTYDHHVTGYVCKCNAGFHGDGYYSCQPVRVTACDGQQNACDRNARCVPTSDGSSFSCICNEGYEGDGYKCHQATDCVSTPTMCDENAACVSENMRYTCRCKTGFHGSGFTCRPDSKARGKSLIFSHGMTLVQRGLQPEDYGKQLVVVPFQIAVGVDFDCSRDKLYWSDVSGHSIRSANLDGSNITVLFDTELSSPEGICVDSINRNLYYADSVRDEIVLVSLKTKSRIAIAVDGLYNPRALALDPVDRKLYFSDWNRQRPVIGRMNFDGSAREAYVTSEISLPNGLVVLPRRREMCWADAGVQRLECMGVSHAGRRVVYAPLGYPFGLTAHNEETFYWTDWEDKRIHSVSVYGGDHQTMTPAAGGSGKMYGIVAIPNDCFTGESACMTNNGGCQYICVPGDHSNSRRCLCPEGVDDAECNRI